MLSVIVAAGMCFRETRLVRFWACQFGRNGDATIPMQVWGSCVYRSFVCKTFISQSDASRVAMLMSTVSSKLLKAVAAVEGFHAEETLTGFKFVDKVQACLWLVTLIMLNDRWLGNRALELTKEGYAVLFAFEEAIGMYFIQIW